MQLCCFKSNGLDGFPCSFKYSGEAQITLSIEHRRVADTSIMPSITSGNLNAPSIMIGEKASDYLAGRAPLAPLDVPVYKPG